MSTMGTGLTRLKVTGTLVVGSILTLMGVGIGAVTQNSGTTILTSTNVIYSSGGLLPIYGSLNLQPTAGYKAPRGGSGVQMIVNPYDKTLLCESPIIRVTTAPTTAFTADIYTATGSTHLVNGTGSYLLRDNFAFGAGITTLTGSQLVGTTSGSTWRFILAKNGTTTSAQQINIVSASGTGHGLVGSYYIPCNALD